MDRARIQREVNELQARGFRTAADTAELVHVYVPFPDGWDVDADWTLLIPDENYPRTPPVPHIRSDREYSDGRVAHRIRTGTRWDRWCTHEFDWDPRRHSLLTMVQLLVASLNQPDASNPFQNHEPPDLGQLFDDTQRQSLGDLFS